MTKKKTKTEDNVSQEGKRMTWECKLCLHDCDNCPKYDWKDSHRECALEICENSQKKPCVLTVELNDGEPLIDGPDTCPFGMSRCYWEPMQENGPEPEQDENAPKVEVIPDDGR